MTQMCLMLGSGHQPPKRRFLAETSATEEATRWWTLDSNPEAKPITLFDLERLEVGDPLPYDNDYFDEIHAYEVLEHFGKQGNFRGFFSTFRQFWRTLKVDGLLIGTCPSIRSEWLWGDPGHTRVINHAVLSFLTKGHYEQLGNSPASDYRKFVEPCWWEIVFVNDNDTTFVFGIKKVR